MKITLPPFRVQAAALLALATVSAAAQDRASDAPWPLAGRLGMMRLVIVPAEQASDRAAYMAQIEQLCEPDRSCFLNFYTNSSGAQLTVPLPDAIDREATAVFRRSTKQGAESFRWSCRLQRPEPHCF